MGAIRLLFMPAEPSAVQCPDGAGGVWARAGKSYDGSIAASAGGGCMSVADASGGKCTAREAARRLAGVDRSGRRAGVTRAAVAVPSVTRRASASIAGVAGKRAEPPPKIK